METGRLEDALSSASRSVASFEDAAARNEMSAMQPNFGNALLNRGEILVRMGRPREAIESLERALTIYRAHRKDDSILETDVYLAEARLQLGDLAEAARLAEEARALADGDKETAPDLLVEVLLVEAKLSFARRQPAEALPHAEQALSLAEKGASLLYDLSGARLVLARALAMGTSTAARARSLAEAARDGFATLHDDARTDEASAFLATAR
jgi:tetratricopeptide (TPR) repeat protein